MSGAGAYWVDGQPVAPEAFYQVACNPQRSVVVEACAGAGKTWMLVSRMLRAMMAGTPPHQILAITFTRKAAGEMRARLQEWMQEFAHASDEACDQALLQRGVAHADLPGMRERLRGLQAAWMADGRGVEIHTILGWFAKLVQGAPLDLLHELGLPPDMQLVEDSEALWPALWGRFLRCVDGDETRRARLAASIDDVGRHNTEAWLKQALSNRLEIELAAQHGRLLNSVEDASWLGGQWAEGEGTEASILQAWRRPAVQDALWALARKLGASTKKTQRDAGAALERAMTLGLETQDDRTTMHAMRAVLFTGTGTPRKAVEELDEAAWVLGWWEDWGAALSQARAHSQHLRLCELSAVLLAEYRQLKAEQGVADMVDLELAAARLMADPVMSGWVQERLDHQVRHVLMDEFQDTSPLQWHTLKAWLSAYAGAGGGSSGQMAPSVFLVGDPKQSIYRFRRADPRVFQAAQRFVIDALDGAHLACDHTRRNAQSVIRALNMGLGAAAAVGRFPGFREHTSASAAEGMVWALPQVKRDKDSAVEPDASPVHEDAQGLPEGWRDSLRTPRYSVEVSRKEREAEQVADCIQHLMGEGGVAPQDIFVLARRRVTLEAVAQALSLRQLSHIAPESDLLTDKIEVQDLMAAVEALLSPAGSLALAQALRSPLFGASDDDLQWLASRVDRTASGWLPCLLALARQADASDMPAALQRAAACFGAWQLDLPHLPPHDLLERIVRDTDLRAALARTVPEGHAARALFHVDTLLAHSLAANAGRDTTPYRWLRQLRRDPPKLPARAAQNAVQLLTVHGAKGLEAEVVILADMDAEASRSNTYSLMIDWPEGEAAPVRCAFVASEVRCAPSLQALRDSERQADAVEDMNALYVALTRARSSLVFSSTQPRSEQPRSWWNLLHEAGVAPAQLALPARSASEAAALVRAPVFDLPVLPTLPPAPVAANSGRADAPTDALLGQWVHAALERLTLRPATQRQAAQLVQAVSACKQALQGQAHAAAGADWDSLQAQALNIVQGLLQAPGLAAWLSPEPWAYAANEVPLADEQGQMRLDRLVAQADPDGQRTWWVIDYKLQHDPMANEAYLHQMARYVAAVQRVQPADRVGGGFITGHGQWLVWREPA
ncbi:MAG: hypothetical protein RI907_1664 [Pseudomonadota bacterium]|jgi:ATP-dependent helicase/nuclease subunit A